MLFVYTVYILYTMMMATASKVRKVRAKADPTISVDDLKMPLAKFMKLKGTRDVFELLKPLEKSQYTSGVDAQALVELDSLLFDYASVCKTGVLPSVKHISALKSLNSHYEPGIGVLKMNFSDQQDDVVFDWVDLKIKTCLKWLRQIKHPRSEERRRVMSILHTDEWHSVNCILECLTAPWLYPTLYCSIVYTHVNI